MSVTSIHRPRVKRALRALPQSLGHSTDAANDEDRLMAIEEGFRVNQTAAHLLRLGPHALPTLREELAATRGLRRQGIISALWHYHEPADIPVFIEQLHRGDSNRRRQAASFLATFDGPDIRLALCKALGDPVPIVRATAIRSLRTSGAGLPRNLRPTLLRDPDPGVRQATMERTG